MFEGEVRIQRCTRHPSRTDASRTDFVKVKGRVAVINKSQVMARYKCKGIRSNWTEDNMKFALSAVKRGVMKVYTAAKHYNVPRRTLRRYLVEKKETKSTLGRKPLLNSEQEQNLASRIIRLCNVGYPLTQRVLRTCVKIFCDRNNVPSSSRGLMVGRDWLRGFLKRHKNISRRKAQNLNPARAQKLNKAVVADYFAKLKKVMEENYIMNKPERIFNIDEKGCQLNLHKAPQVLAERGIKRVHLVAPEHGENVTIVSCASALGHAIPPMILFKGKRMKPEWVDSLPTGAVAQMTPKGSMNTETFVNWIHHFAKFKLSGPCLLIFDGAKCHLDYSIVDSAEKFDIKLFCLPSNTTHELQPMDKSVFRSYEYYWDEEVLKYWSIHEDRKITKHRFGVIFSKVWDKAATPANIKAGFEATGIFPFNPEKIPEEAYAPSIPTYNPAISGPSFTGSNEIDDPKDSDATDASESLLILSHPLLNTSNDNSRPPTQHPVQNNASNGNPLLNQHPAQDDSSDDNIPSILYLHPNDGLENNPLVKQDTFSRNNHSLSTSCDDYNSNDDIPLAELKQKKWNREISRSDLDPVSPARLNESYQSFCEMLKTPEKISSPKAAPRARAINSLAQELKKSTFTDKENMPGLYNVAPQKRNRDPANTAKRQPVASKKVPLKHPRGKGKSRKTAESWYCFVCNEDRVADMRPCFLCATYVHEDCVGLTEEDTDKFVCIKCSED